jgi:hypothetical protein
MFRIFFIASLFFLSDARAQSLTELRAKYPESYAVVLNYTEDTRIYIENGQPVAETKVVKEILVLDDKANGIYNKYYVYHGSFDEFTNIEAYTKVPSGDGYTKIKVQEIQTASSRSKGVFYDDVKETKFDFPALSAGAIAYISYTIIEKDGHMLTPLYMRSYMPVVKEKFTITYPPSVEFLFTVKNDQAKIISITENKKGKNHSTIFAAENVKESEHFGGAPAASYYEPHVIIRIGSYKNEAGQQISYLKQIDDLYKWNYGFIKQMQEQDESEIKELADSLTANVSTEREKARRIYQWVQANIKYVAFENGLEGFIPRNAALVCSRRFGDCKDMASLLTLLLKKAGIKAYFTWIGTRDIPYDYREVPQPITDNHMISSIQIDGKWIFLDGTDPNCIFGFPSGFIQGKQALVGISEDKYELVQVPEVAAEKNMALDSTFISLSEKGISGRSNVFYYGYYGIDVNNAIFYKNADDTRDYVKFRMGKASNKFILDNYSIKHTDRDNKTINIKASFEVPDYGKKIGNEWYINLNLEKFFTNGSLIDTAKRKVGIENDYKSVIRQYAILALPPGYTATDVPDNFISDNEVINFSITYTKEKDRIIACQQFTNKTLLLMPDQFAAWNDTVKKYWHSIKSRWSWQNNKV